LRGEEKMPQEEEDASFYQLAYQAAGKQTESADERRERTRRGFPRTQMVAPYVEGRTPVSGDFAAVRFRDISEQGFSYVSSKPPEYDAVVVVLGEPPAATYLTAVVCHCTSAGTQAKPRYIVGCRFTGRIELDVNPQRRPSI
jgi:hypothetical protein